MEGKKIKTFEEMSAALGDITPKQAYYLAKLGQKILKIGGTGAAPRLIGMVTDSMYNDPYNVYFAAQVETLEIARALAEVHEDELSEGMTLSELTGVTVEDDIYLTKRRKEGGAA